MLSIYHGLLFCGRLLKPLDGKRIVRRSIFSEPSGLGLSFSIRSSATYSAQGISSEIYIAFRLLNRAILGAVAAVIQKCTRPANKLRKRNLLKIGFTLALICHPIQSSGYLKLKSCFG